MLLAALFQHHWIIKIPNDNFIDRQMQASTDIFATLWFIFEAIRNDLFTLYIYAYNIVNASVFNLFIHY
jgi:hypothetical protein